MNIIEHGLIAVPDADANTIGSIVLWSMTGGVDGNKLVDAWEASGLDANWLPDTVSKRVALRRAVNEQEDAKFISARLLKSDAYVIVAKDVKVDDVGFQTEVKVALDKGVLVFDPPTHALAQTIQDAYNKYLNSLTTSDISTWLTRLTKHCQATSIRPTGGGVYFVPATRMETWRKITSSISKASSHYFAEIPSMRSAKAVEAITTALVNSINSQVELIQADFDDNTVGEKAVQHRYDKVDSMLAKVTEYEKVLSTQLPNLKNSLTKLQGFIYSTKMVASEDISLPA
jgi:hypothetical protein